MAYSSGQVSVGTSATQILTTGPAPAFDVVIYSSATVYLGGSNVTTSNGLEIPASTPTRIPSSGAEDDVLYGIASSGTATVGYLTIT